MQLHIFDIEFCCKLFEIEIEFYGWLLLVNIVLHSSVNHRRKCLEKACDFFFCSSVIFFTDYFPYGNDPYFITTEKCVDSNILNVSVSWIKEFFSAILYKKDF